MSDQEPLPETFKMPAELRALVEVHDGWEAARDFLLGHKMAMYHCDEDPHNEGQLCDCMFRLLAWWAEQRVEIQRLQKELSRTKSELRSEKIGHTKTMNLLHGLQDQLAGR